jgi:hypothetical protein
MYSKIKYMSASSFERQVKSMSVEELLSLSAALRRDSVEINEELQVITEAIVAARIERVKKRLEHPSDDAGTAPQ